MPAGLEPARGRASSGRAASAASRRGRRQAAEAGADLRSKYADVPPPLPCIVYEPVSPRDAGLFLLDAGGARTREGASVKRTRSVRSEPARTPAGSRSRCGFAQQMRGRPTAPTIWFLRARVPQGCGLVSFTRRRGSKLRWNRSCLYRLPAYLGTISPQLRGRRLKSTQARGPADGGGRAVESLVDGGGHAGE